MKKELFDRMQCPECSSGLTLNVTKVEADNIIDGIIKCQKCGREYPVVDGIARMLIERFK